ERREAVERTKGHRPQELDRRERRSAPEPLDERRRLCRSRSGELFDEVAPHAPPQVGAELERPLLRETELDDVEVVEAREARAEDAAVLVRQLRRRDRRAG